MRNPALWPLAAAALLLAACGSTPPPRPAATPSPVELGPEQRWLQQWFDGTPVRLSAQGDGGVRLEVPLVHAFEPQGAAPKPALRAVLDKLAQSLGRQDMARLQLAAPAPLARERVAAMRSHLGTLGIGPSRLPAGGAPRNDMVVLQLVAAR